MGEMPEHCCWAVQSPPIAVRTRAKGVGVAVRGDAQDVIEFLSGIPDLGERGISGDPGEGESDDLLPAGREHLPENREPRRTPRPSGRNFHMHERYGDASGWSAFFFLWR